MTAYAASVSPAEPAIPARVLVEAIYNRPEGVELQLSGPATHKWKTLTGNPAQGILDRCYVDVSPASIGRRVARFLDNANGPIQHIRLAQFRPGTVRLVLDFRSPQSCHVLTQSAAPRAHRLLVRVGQAPVPEEDRPRSQHEHLSPPTPAQKPAVTPPVRPSAPQASPAVPVPAPLSVQPSTPPQNGRNEQNEQEKQEETAERSTEAASTQDKADTTHTVNPALPVLPTLPDLTHVVWRPAYHVWTFGQVDQPPQAPDQPTSSQVQAPSQAQKKRASESQATRNAFGPSVRSGSHEQPRETTVEEAMRMAWIIAVSIGCILAFLAGGGVVWWFTTRQNRHKNGQTQDDITKQVAKQVAGLEDLVGQAGLLNNDLLEALEHKQKQLELLLTRADWVSQDLRRLLAQVAAGERREGRRSDPYATAALLLTEGETIEDIARTLKLPVAQVRLVHALKQEVGPEKGAAKPEKTTEPAFTQQAIPSLPSNLDEPDAMNLLPDHGTHLAESGQ